eukprot:352749-Chlamydomonas_euryale.AAC.1
MDDIDGVEATKKGRSAAAQTLKLELVRAAVSARTSGQADPHSVCLRARWGTDSALRNGISEDRARCLCRYGAADSPPKLVLR